MTGLIEDLDYTGRRVLVTGAANGFGAAMAAAFAAARGDAGAGGCGSADVGGCGGTAPGCDACV